jgi:3-oxoacyl-[acyl-carrier-protein] synthase II
MPEAEATPAEVRQGGTANRSRRRVVVTGIGAVSGFGWGVEPLWQGLRSAATAIRPFGRFDHRGHRTHLAAEVPPPAGGGLPGGERRPRSGEGGARGGERPARGGGPLGVADRQLSMADRFALAAAGEALAAAGLDGGRLRAAPEGQAGVFFGSSTGGMWETERFLADLLAGRRHPLHSLASQQVNGPGDAVARRFGVTGPVQTISSACASGALAIGAALEAVRDGEVEVALAGGADSLCQLTYAGFNSLRSVDEAPCRPFRAGRAGMSLGEGSAVLVLEPLAGALARGVVPLAELAGAGGSCDAFHMTAPEPDGTGAAAAILAALADAGWQPADVDFVNAHATGTPLNDDAEWRALELVFGSRAERLPVTASKAAVGHLLGSAGAIEAAATVLSLWRRELPPLPGAAAGPVDADCPAALVRGWPLALPEARAAVSTSLAFGGSNAALAFARWTGEAP